MKTLLTLDELAAMPVTKADEALELAEFKDACQRAAAKGDQAHALLNSPECMPDPATVAAWALDYQTEGAK